MGRPHMSTTIKGSVQQDTYRLCGFESQPNAKARSYTVWQAAGASKVGNVDLQSEGARVECER